MATQQADVQRIDPGAGPLPDADATYAWSAPVPAGDGRSAEDWARSIFEDGPAPVRWVVVTGWRWVLRLRLGPPASPDHVMGWAVDDRAPGSVRLAVGSPLLDARIVVAVDGGRVSHSSYVRHRRRLGRILWAPAGLIHQVVVPYLLRHAVS